MGALGPGHFWTPEDFQAFRVTIGSLIGESERDPLPLTEIELTVPTSLSDMQTVATNQTSCRAYVAVVVKPSKITGSGARGETGSLSLSDRPDGGSNRDRKG